MRVADSVVWVKRRLREMLRAFAAEVQQVGDRGAKDIILDPGYGFGKALEQNYQIMAEAERLLVLELPVLAGISRKSMIYKLTGGTPETSLCGTVALNTVSLMKGAGILRVHDVKEAVDTVRMVSMMSASGQ